MKILNFKDEDKVAINLQLVGGGKQFAVCTFAQAKEIVGHFDGFMQMSDEDRSKHTLFLQAPDYYFLILSKMVIGYEIYAAKPKENIAEQFMKKAIEAIEKPWPGEDWKKED